MEAVPRLPMVGFKLKTSEEKPNFSPKLKQYIEAQYGEDGEAFSSQLHQLEGLRASAVRPSVDIAGCSTLKKYYCQLHFLISRFPMNKGGAAAVTFMWRDPYSDASIHAPDITIEMASILYNIGALHSQLGALEDRTNADTLRMACTHFQCAAWAFSHIVEEFPQVMSYEPAAELLSFMNSVCLAQAQECILEKGMLDNRKAAIVAKISAQTVDFYKVALAKLSKSSSSSDEGSIADTVRPSTRSKWEAIFKFKISYYTCITLLYQGQQAEEEQKMGERVAYYAAAADKLEEAAKLNKGLKGVKDTLAFTQDVVIGKRKIANNENEYIYHEQVPDVATLPLVKGAVLAKGTGFDVTDPEIAGADLFASLIPLKAHETSSVYSEMLAEMMRSVTSRVQMRDEELQQLLSTVHVSEPPSPERHLPQPLIDRCAALNGKPGAVDTLVELLDSLTNTYEGVQVMLEDISQLLSDEQRDAEEYEKLVGKRPPSIVATDLTREANKYQDAHAKASESNRTLKKALDMHLSNLTVLSTHSLKELDQLLPQVQISPDYAAVVQKMAALMGKVDEMRQQRSLFLNQLRDAMQHDDITAKIVTYQGDKAELCKKEIAKHDEQINLINMNLTAQDAIMAAIQELYPRYGEARGSLVASQKQRNAAINYLMSSYDAYEDLIVKSNKGLEFYNKLHANVSKLQQRVRSTCKVQQEERNQVMSNIKSETRNNQGTERGQGVVMDRIYNDVSEPPVTQGLKLKDYLNMKKETGKMALVSGPVPGIRPTPVGSEVNEPAPLSGFDSDLKSYPPYMQDPAMQYGGQYGYPASQGYGYQPPVSQEYPYRPSPCGTPSYSQPAPTQPYNTYGYPNQPSLPSSNQYGAGVQPNTYSTQGSQPSAGYLPANNYQPSQNVPVSRNESYQPTKPAHFSQNYEANRPATEQNQPYVQPMYSGVAGGLLQQQPVYMTTEVTAAHQSGTGLEKPQSYQQPYSTGTSQPTPIASQSYYGGNNCYPGAYQAAPLGSDYTAAGNVPQQLYSAASTQPSSVYPGAFQTPSSGTPHVFTGTTSTTPAPQPSGTPQPYSYTQLCSGYPSAYQSAPSPAGSIPDYAAPNSASVVSPTKQVTPQSYPPAAPATDIDALAKIFENATDFSAPRKSNSLLDNCYVSSQMGYEDGNTPSYIYHENQQYVSNPAASSTTGLPTVGSPAPVPSFSTNTGTSVRGYIGAAPLPRNPPTGTYYPTSTDPPAGSYPASATPVAPGTGYTATSGSASTAMSNYSAPGYSSLTAPQATHGYVATPPNPQPAGPAFTSQPAASSTLDLLAGLDVSISQPVLQPSMVPIITKKEVAKPEEKKKEAPTVKTETAAVVGNVAVKREKSESRRTSVAQAQPLEGDALALFIAEVDKLDKLVSALTISTLNGPTSLDLKWKDIVDAQERDCVRRSISVARCYPMKNRYPDILPYDDSRIELPGTKDDYINASYLKEMCEGMPSVIMTQAPLPTTYADFWTMILQNNVEVVVCMASDEDLGSDIYWPLDKDRPVVAGGVKAALQSCVAHNHTVQRVLSVTDGNVTRVVLHMQFTNWSSSSLPSSPGPLVGFVEEVRFLLCQQRSGAHPFVVHCTWGIGRTGVLTGLLAALAHVEYTATIPDIMALATAVTRARKNALRDREHLKFFYQAVLYYCQQLLLKRGILTNRTFEDNKSEGKCHTRHPSQDFVLSTSQPNIPSDEMDGTSVESAAVEEPLLAAMDPAKFSLATDAKQKPKISRESFSRPPVPLTVPSDDPLSSLDPLWSLNRS